MSHWPVSNARPFCLPPRQLSHRRLHRSPDRLPTPFAYRRRHPGARNARWNCGLLDRGKSLHFHFWLMRFGFVWAPHRTLGNERNFVTDQ